MIFSQYAFDVEDFCSHEYECSDGCDDSNRNSLKYKFIIKINGIKRLLI